MINLPVKNILFFCFLILSNCLISQAQKNDSIKNTITKSQTELKKFYTDSTSTPLSRAERKEFKGINFFPIDLAYRVTAKIEKFKTSDTLNFPTSNGSIKRYIRYAKATFSIKGKKCSLTLFRRAGIAQTAEGVYYLFLPFTDLTSNEETYGGGRYIDLESSNKNTMIIDFNLCYHPYCAYSHNGWSCPVPPKENFADVKILAGVKN